MTADIISPSEIQSELSRLWDAIEGKNKTHAALFNLVFFTEKKARAEYIHTLAENVIEKFPSRVIFITADFESSQDYLNTRVSVVSAGKEETDIACDFIQIEAGGKHLERIPFVILPHFVTDLPIYTIWAEAPFLDSPLFKTLQKLSSRFIFDSEAIDNLPEFAKTLIEFEKNPHLDIADLNWARMEKWRELLASTFYREERLEKLKEAQNIQIFYNSRESNFTCHPTIQAAYLQGWLSTQLDWHLKKMDKQDKALHLHYTKREGIVEIVLTPESHDNLKPGAIVSIDIETESRDHFSFGRNLQLPHHVSMRFSTLEKCDIPLTYIFAKDESGGSLVKEISHKGTSKHFLNLLKTIAELKELPLQ